MSKVSGNRGLSFSANLDISGAKKNAEDLKKILNDLKIQSAGAGAGLTDTKPLTNYQQAQLKLQESLRDARLEVQRLIQANQLLRNEQEQGKIAAQNNRVEVEKLKITEQELKNQLQAGKITQQQYTEAVNKNKIAQQELNAELTKAAIRDKEAATALKEHNLEQKKIAQSARDAKAANVVLSGSYKEASQRLAELRERITGVQDGFKNQTPEFKAKVKEYNDLNTALKAFDDKMGNHQRNVGNYGGALRGAAEDLAGMATAYLSAGSALQFILSSTLEFNKIKNPLTFILGSEGDANNKLAELKKFANDLGLDFFTLANTYKSFTAAARASNFDLDKSEKIFRSVAKSGAVLGLSTDEMSGSLLAVQQMISKGNVQAEELRGQLSERLPGAFALSAKAMGVTEQELNKLLQSGSVLASDLLPKLAEQLDKRYGDKAADGIHGLNAEINGLKSALQSLAGEGSAVSKNLFEPIARGAKNLALELSQFFRGSFTENIQYALTFSNKSLANQRNAYDLRDSNTNNQDALQSVKKKDLSTLGLGELRTAYTQIDATYKQAVRDYKNFEAGVKNGTLKETNKATVASFFNVAAGLREERKRVGEELEKAKGIQVKGNKELADSALTAVSDIRKRITQLQKMDGSADPGSEVAKRIEALQARIKKGGDSAAKAEINSRNSLQAQIDAQTKRGVDKEKTATEQELSAVDAKYAALRKKANDFNNDPKNKAKGLRVDAGGLVTAQSNETTAVHNKKEAADLKATIDEQKKLYDEYENYKTKVGKEKADERYKDLINTDISYLEKLKQLESAQTDPQKSKGGDEAQANPFAMKLLGEEIAAAKLAQQKADDEIYAYAFQSALTHSQKLQGIDADYNMKRKALGDAATADQIANLERERQARIQEANEANAYAKGGYDKLMQDFDSLTRGAILKRLQAIKEGYQEEYKAGKLTAEQLANLVSNVNGQIDALNGDNAFKKVTEAIKRYREQVKLLGKDSEGAKDAQDGMYAAIAESAGDINEVMGEIASSLDELGIGGEKTQKAFKDIMGVVDGAGKIAKGLATGNPVDVITGSIKLLTSAISLFNNKDIKLQAKIDNYKAQLASLGTAYEKLDRAVNNSVGESIYTDSAKQIENLRKQQALLIQMRDAEEAKKKTDASKIADYNAQIDAIPGKIEDINKAISENLIQTNFKDLSQSLADALSEAFAAGEDAAGRFDDAFNKVIVNAVKNSLRLKLLEPIINDFTNDLTDYAKKNDNSIIGFDFDKWKKAIEEKGKLYTEGLEAVKDYLPTDASGSTSTDSNLTKNIKQITSEQASALEGIMRGTYDLNKQVVSNTSLLQPIGKSIGDLYQTAVGNLAYSAQIAQNTADTVVELKNAVVELKTISKNTVPTNVRGGGF